MCLISHVLRIFSCDDDFFPLNAVAVTLLISVGFALSYKLMSSTISLWNAAALAKAKRPHKLIVISGCDSGLGMAMAYWAGKLGYKILAGCLNTNSEGATFLKREFGEENCRVVGLNVKESESLNNFRNECESIIENDKGETDLHALVPNAAVGGFGEFFWQSESQLKEMMDVNFWGSVNLTKAFEPLLLQNKSRLILISSDCSEYPLPGLAMYSASKAALQAWAGSLRHEVSKYGVSVVAFQPGNFPMNSRLFARQEVFCKDMETHVLKKDEQLIKFYGKYFHEYNQHCVKLFTEKPLNLSPMEDRNIMKSFMLLLEDDIRHKPLHIYDEIGVQIFHFLLRNLPTKWADSLIVNLLKFPVWKEPSTIQ